MLAHPGLVSAKILRMSLVLDAKSCVAEQVAWPEQKRSTLRFPAEHGIGKGELAPYGSSTSAFPPSVTEKAFGSIPSTESV